MGFGQLGLWAFWTTEALGDLDFGQLELWVTCLHGSNLDFWQFGQLRLLVTWAFGQLGLWTLWVTWTLDTLGNLDMG